MGFVEKLICYPAGSSRLIKRACYGSRWVNVSKIFESFAWRLFLLGEIMKKDKKTEMVILRVTPDEHRSIRKTAKTFKQSMSSYILTLHNIASAKGKNAN